MSYRSFRRLDVSFALACIVLLSACMAPALQTLNDSSRRQECTNNMRLLSLAVHTFHDTRRGLPPVSIGPGRPAVFASLLPYLEQRPIYETLIADRGRRVQDAWDELDENYRNAAGSIKVFQCPSRRNGVDIISKGPGRGPLGDYAVPIVWVGSEGTWEDYYDPCKHPNLGRKMNHSPLLPGKVDCPADGEPTDEQYAQARPAVDMAYLAIAGTSNTIILGEKHVRRAELGKCCGTNLNSGSDGSHFYADKDSQMYGVGRSANLPIGIGPNAFAEPNSGPDDDFGFGSWHAGVFDVAFADGSTRFLSADVDPKMFARACNPRDTETSTLRTISK